MQDHRQLRGSDSKWLPMLRRATAEQSFLGTGEQVMIHQKMRHWLRVSVTSVLVFTITAIVQPGDRSGLCLSQEPESLRYTISNQAVVLEVVPGQVGIVTAQVGMTENKRAEFRAALTDQGASDVEFFRDGIFILKGTDEQNFPKMMQAVERMQGRPDGRDDKDQPKRGLVVRLAGAEERMVLPNEILVRFAPTATQEQIRPLMAEYSLEVVRENPSRRNQLTARVKDGTPQDAVQVVDRLNGNEMVVVAQPNFYRLRQYRQEIPNDPLFDRQWHHQNTGQNGGTPDADIDTPLAWEITRGSQDVIIAVIDGGFDDQHPDLLPNLWTNVGEVPGNGIDDDGNGYVDDIHGWNFTFDNGDLRPGPFPDHGTAVAGCAGARGDNNEGVSGSAPLCRLMLLTLGSGDDKDAEAFDYARRMGAHIITNSWGYSISPAVNPLVITGIDDAATSGRSGRGCVVLFAMNNPNVNDCIGNRPDISSLDSVIAVSRASNRDRFDFSGFGNCMDVLGPTRASGGTGTLGITTTAIQGQGSDPTRNYRFDFGGTSAATPITAGIAALVLAESPCLERLQVQQLLQDTADRVEDSTGHYRTADGFSQPADGHATHGYGRVNAFEAVRTVAARHRGGRGGYDLMIRDNRLDWGNTEQPSNTAFEPTRQFIPHWHSVDIKVDAPPFQSSPTTSAAFETLIDEDPRAATGNRVYVRVRNRGPLTVDQAIVKLQWAFAGTSLPALPTDFWARFPEDSADTSAWRPIDKVPLADVAYSGSSTVGGGDAAQIAQFLWQAPSLDPNQPAFQHFCVLAVVNSPQDPVSQLARDSFVPDFITPRDNNVTHRNLVLQPNLEEIETLVGFFLRNPTTESIRSRLTVIAPDGWEVEVKNAEENGSAIRLDENFALQAGQEIPIVARIRRPDRQALGLATFVQQHIGGQEVETLGGLTVRFGEKTPLLLLPRRQATAPPRNDDATTEERPNGRPVPVKREK
ncbi:S8 family serine peptidase [Novipirellula sp.]|uniref:S8 family serine peptidase n=1 Tax=Novipirellula sp. TaxID=2795430 RepID=UPI00356ABB8C